MTIQSRSPRTRWINLVPTELYDFAWGEDAWCYVEDKAKLVAEAARVVKRNGVVAFTDWMEGKPELAPKEAARYLAFMKFPGILSLREYGALLVSSGCEVLTQLDTGRFAAHIQLYLDMLEKQLTYDALKLIGFDPAVAETLLGEMRFVLELAQAGKIIQGLIVARKRP